jgi:hypothetical protein
VNTYRFSLQFLPSSSPGAKSVLRSKSEGSAPAALVTARCDRANLEDLHGFSHGLREFENPWNPRYPGPYPTLIALNGEFVYWTPLRKNPWNVYLGAGPAANIFSFGGVSNRNTDVRPGFNLLIGIAQRKGLFSEIKIGTIDSPSFKFGIGYTFPSGL